VHPAIRLLLADDHLAFHQPLARLLQREPDLAVAAEAGSLAEARWMLRERLGRIHLAAIDLQLPDGDETAVMSDFWAHHPRGQGLVLTGVVNAGHHARALRVGAAAVVSKGTHPDVIIAHVRRVHAGDGPAPAS
jgi:two-component system response regulator DesR